MLYEMTRVREESILGVRPPVRERLSHGAPVASFRLPVRLEVSQSGATAQPRILTPEQVREREFARHILKQEIHPKFITAPCVNRGSTIWNAERLGRYNAAAYQFTRYVLNDRNSSTEDEQFTADVQDARRRIFEDRLANFTEPKRRLVARILATESGFLQTLALMRLGADVEAGQALERATRIFMDPFLPPVRPQEQMGAQALNLWAKWLRDPDLVPEGFRGRAAVQATTMESLARTRINESGQHPGSLTASVATQAAGINWNRRQMNERERRDSLIRTSAVDWQLRILLDGASTPAARQRIVDTINSELRRRGSDVQFEDCREVSMLHSGGRPWQLALRHGPLPERESSQVLFPLTHPR